MYILCFNCNKIYKLPKNVKPLYVEYKKRDKPWPLNKNYSSKTYLFTMFPRKRRKDRFKNKWTMSVLLFKNVWQWQNTTFCLPWM